MGTHPILESDFDCLTEMTNEVNGDDETENLSQLVSALEANDHSSIDQSERSIQRSTNPDSTSPRPSPTSRNSNNVIMDALNILPDYPRRDARFYDRLSTYEMFPDSCPVRPEHLAKAGFRFTNMQDMVICDYCDGRLQRWEATDDPVEEHVRHYGNRCPFMLPLTQQPHNAVYTTLEARQSSFENEIWERHDNRHAPSAEDLAEAGFYFVGGLEQDRMAAPDVNQQRPVYRSDATKCFHCNTTLHSWEENDNVWVEHAKWSPKCGFLIGRVGYDFVLQCQSGTDEDIEPGGANSMSRTRNGLHAGNDFADTPPEMQARYRERGIQSVNTQIQTADLTRKDEPINTPVTPEEYQNEYENLVKQIQCKVCLANRSSILFLPCRHVSVCTECAVRLPDDTCPLCRQHIEHMIDAYIS